MTAADVFYSALVIVTLVLTYLAGKCDFLNVVCLMMQERAKKLEEAIEDGTEEG